MYYLYVKKHRKTGMKYLGYTSKDNVNQYTGSGKYWLKHLAKHGSDCVVTHILFESENRDLVALWGVFFSDLYNVVESDEWANLIVENTRGPSSADATRMRLEQVKNGTHQWLGENNPSKKMVADGTHHLLGGEIARKLVADGKHHFCDADKQKEMAQKKVKAGTHNFFMVSCVDKEGKRIMIPKEEYHSQTGPKEDWEYLHYRSKELSKRGIKVPGLGKKRGKYKKGSANSC